MGSLFNEKFKKNQHTVPNTAAHSLRIELAAKLEEKFDSIETAFEYYSEGLCPILQLLCSRLNAMLSQACLFMQTELSSKVRPKMIPLFGHGLPA